MDEYIVIEFSGWATIDPKNVRFCSLNPNGNIIDGEAWIALDEYERSWYVLEDAIAFQRDSFDGEYTTLDVFIENDNDE